jgi:hypothetical protein
MQTLGIINFVVIPTEREKKTGMWPTDEQVMKSRKRK